MTFENVKIEKSIKEIRSDLQYVKRNMGLYLVDEDILVNVIQPEMEDGTMSLEQFLVWCIYDRIAFALYDSDAEAEDSHFMAYDKRIQAIINDYNLDIEAE